MSATGTNANENVRLVVVLAHFGSQPHGERTYESRHSGWNPRFRPCSFCEKDIDTQETSYQTARDEDDWLHHFHTTCTCSVDGVPCAGVQSHLPIARATGVRHCHVCEQPVGTPFQVNSTHVAEEIFCSSSCVEIDYHTTQDLSEDDS